MKHIVILGKLESKHLCPYFNNPDVEIWSMNSHWDESLLAGPVDKWFDLHHNPERENADYTIENFPFEECHKLVHGRRFCTTMAYMMAFAVLQGAEKLSIYGARFSDDGNSRRARELHNVREMLFFLMAKDVEIEICEEDKEYLFPEHIVSEDEDFDQ